MKLFIPIIMMLISVIVAPKQGNAVPDKLLVVDAYNLPSDCTYITVVPIVDRNKNIGWIDTIKEYCHKEPGFGTTARNWLKFSGQDGYVYSLQISVHGPSPKVINVPGWWYLGSSFPTTYPGPGR